MAYQDDQQIPMTREEIADWWDRVNLSMEARKRHETRWDALLTAYLPSESPEAINSNRHFRNTEQRKSRLFFRTPELVLSAREPLKDVVMGPDGQRHTSADVVTIKQAVLNKQLGRDGVNAKRLMDEVLFDILQPAGLSPTLICYEADFVDVEEEVVVGEQPLAGSVLGLQTTPITETQKVPVPVYEEWSWKRFSPKKLLIPHDWHSTRYDDAPWIGMQFVMPLALAMREYQLPADFESNTTHDAYVFEAGKTKADGKSSAPLVEGVSIWYKPAYFPKTGVTHRQMIRRLVLIKQLEHRPAKHTMSPYQALDAQSRLTADSMIGFPIHVFTLRDLSDSAYVPSDAAMTDPLIRQRNTWRSQDIKRRDANIPRFLYDVAIKEALDKLRDGDVGDGAEVASGTLAQGIERLIVELPKLEKAVADVQGEASIDRDIDETLALGPNQSGSVNTSVRSATEIATAQSSTNAREEAEQNRLLGDFLVGVRKFDSLIMRFASEADYIQWVGQDGSRRLAQWNKDLVAGRYAYDAKPDSSKQIDAAQDRQQWVQALNLTFGAPESNRVEILRRFWEKFGEDGSLLVAPPPPKTPEPPKLSIAIKMEDFVLAQGPVTAEIAQQLGLKISADAIQLSQAMHQQDALLAAAAAANKDPDAGPKTEHDGAMEGMAGGLSPISKHAGEMTGAPVGRGPM